jgi:hypothetical protein
MSGAELTRATLVDAVASLQQVYADQPLGNLRQGIGLVELLLSSDAQEAQVLGCEVLAELNAAGKDAYRTWLALVPATRHILASGTVPQQIDALHTLGQFRYVLKYARGLNEHAARVKARSVLESCLVDAAPHLSASPRVASEAAQALRVLVDNGASLEGVRAKVQEALDHRQVSVRSACSTALSIHSRRTGEEPELPNGVSCRRTYARNDQPVTEQAPSTCALCGADEVRLIYDEDDGAQFYRLYTSERHCSACGRYFSRVFRAPG